ncbi:disease resistance-like protein DSC1 [Senna tora]|uniref:Disease resistance-like protein DSC1 n=1 Tax=Senna tora TaxID=362788 RepID=A0A834WCI5_9FABA|nr:disease resistance-like protein DSC1 [Senna tora]
MQSLVLLLMKIESGRNPCSDTDTETPVQRLPVSIKHLPCLKSLIVSDCTSLECLPELPPSIEEVKAVNCSSLEIVNFTSLRPKMACAQFQNCIHERIKRKRATSDSEILLKMVYDCDVLEIKEWGVCPTYASEYQNFINGMESEFEEDSASVMGDGWWDETEDEEETVYPNNESSENSLFRFSFDASHPMELFGSIVSLCAVLEIVLWIIPANHVFGFTSRFIKLFRYSFLFFILLEIRLRLTHLSHEFWGQTSG